MRNRDTTPNRRSGVPACTLSEQPVLALTVPPPWSHWTATGITPVINCASEPPAGWRGRLIIHAGKKIDHDAARYGAQLGYVVRPHEVNRGEFIAVADLADVHYAGEGCADACLGWGQPGRYHWVLAGVRRITAVEGRGHQRLFVPPADVLDLVRASDA